MTDELNATPRPQRHLRHQQVEELAPLTSAQRIVAKFGGAKRLHQALRHVGHVVSAPRVYRWTLPPGVRDSTGGVIPAKHHDALFAAARAEGIVLVAADFDPRKTRSFQP